VIYFLQSIDGSPIKIGCSRDVDNRRTQLETYYGCPLAILGTRPGGKTEERAIHEQFSHLRLGRTEQFKPAADLMEFIGRPLLVGANPAAVEALSQPKTIRIRATGEWVAWLERAAKHCRTDVAKFLDKAAAEYAKANSFDEPPPERIP
jgi:hypothetical protein